MNAPPAASAEELKLYWDEACGSDAALRAKVEALFQADANAGAYMNRPAAEALAAVNEMPADLDSPGAQIGRYKLLERLSPADCR